MNSKKDMFKPSILYMTHKEMMEYFRKTHKESSWMYEKKKK